jgi:hypothetical protein
MLSHHICIEDDGIERELFPVQVAITFLCPVSLGWRSEAERIT